MENKRTSFILAVFSSLLLFLIGCGEKFWDPTQIGRFRPVPTVNVILDSLGVAEEEPSTWAGAEDPKPVDIMLLENDYIFHPGDTVRISIFELQQPGAMFANEYVVTETGKISIPEIGVVQAEGLTESQLEEEIKSILSPTILKNPAVTVMLLSSQQRTFSILGNGVPAPGRYTIPRYDYRLTDALAAAGGPAQFNVSDVFVSRAVTGKEVITELPAEQAEKSAPSESTTTEPARSELTIPEQPNQKKLFDQAQKEMLEIIAPASLQEASRNTKIVTLTEMATGNEIVESNIKQTGQIEWIFREGKWVPVEIGVKEPEKPAAKQEKAKTEYKIPKTKEEETLEFGWEELATGGLQRRVIKIPVDKLLSGDPRYNIIIRPGDSIHVPVDIVGEFLVQGNVNAQGFINITGRPITLKMAIAAAGGLGPLAWPKRCEVIRRIGKNREEIVMVDLEKIARGEQPDFFIKPNDLINVGTHPTARWRAVLRNAFRATYGFGFVYDRNFADRDYGTGRPIDWIF